MLIYLPLTILLLVLPYTGHSRQAERRAPRPRRLGDIWRALAEARADRRIITMIVLAGATSFFVGNAFQAQMPEYAHHLGTDEAGGWYSVLLAANAAGRGPRRGAPRELRRARGRACARRSSAPGRGALAIGLFPAARSYGVAIALLVLAGAFNIAFTSMAQTLVQLLAPPRVRGSIVGLFNTAILGLRAGSGLTVGLLGAVIGVRWSLALSAGAVVAISAALLGRQFRDVEGGVAGATSPSGGQRPN